MKKITRLSLLISLLERFRSGENIELFQLIEDEYQNANRDYIESMPIVRLRFLIENNQLFYKEPESM